MTLLQRARESGTCPPSLLTESSLTSEDGFEEAVSKILDPNGELIVMVVFHVGLPLNLYQTRFLSQQPRVLLLFCLLCRLFLGIQWKRRWGLQDCYAGKLPMNWWLRARCLLRTRGRMESYYYSVTSWMESVQTRKTEVLLKEWSCFSLGPFQVNCRELKTSVLERQRTRDPYEDPLLYVLPSSGGQDFVLCTTSATCLASYLPTMFSKIVNIY